jgi:hypothetical protein
VAGWQQCRAKDAGSEANGAGEVRMLSCALFDKHVLAEVSHGE